MTSNGHATTITPTQTNRRSLSSIAGHAPTSSPWSEPAAGAAEPTQAQNTLTEAELTDVVQTLQGCTGQASWSVFGKRISGKMGDEIYLVHTITAPTSAASSNIGKTAATLMAQGMNDLLPGQPALFEAVTHAPNILGAVYQVQVSAIKLRDALRQEGVKEALKSPLAKLVTLPLDLTARTNRSVSPEEMDAKKRDAEKYLPLIENATGKMGWSLALIDTPAIRDDEGKVQQPANRHYDLAYTVTAPAPENGKYESCVLAQRLNTLLAEQGVTEPLFVAEFFDNHTYGGAYRIRASMDRVKDPNGEKDNPTLDPKLLNALKAISQLGQQRSL